MTKAISVERLAGLIQVIFGQKRRLTVRTTGLDLRGVEGTFALRAFEIDEIGHRLFSGWPWGL
jgi:hypothetical protein